MKKFSKDRKNWLIIALVAIVVVMAVGYAAFSQQLTINSTSNITSTWDVEITNIEVLRRTIGASDADGSPSYDNSNGLTASFTTNLVSPSDFEIYRIEVTNKGTLNAKLNSIEGPTGSTPNIGFYINQSENGNSIVDDGGYRQINEGSILNPSGDSSNLNKGYIYVKVIYENYSGQISPTGDARTASTQIKLNFVQTNDAAVPEVTPLVINQTFIPQYYEYHTGSEVDLGSTADTANWVQDSNELGRSYYIGHDVENGKVTANYVCFVIEGTQYCMKGRVSTADNYYTTNKEYVLRPLKDANLVSCQSWLQSPARCSSSELGLLSARDDGRVSVGLNNDIRCYTTTTKSVKCDE